MVDGRSRVLPRDQDQVDADRQFVPHMPEGLAHQSFDSASLDGIAVLLRNTQPATCFAEFVPRSEHEQVIVAGPDLTVVDATKLGGLTKLRRFRK